jgi:hypothetical protein
MPDENPYRYEGTAESLTAPSEPPRTVHPPSGMALFTAGVGGTIVAGLIVSLFYQQNSSAGSLILIAFELPPIGVFITSYKRKRNLLLAQLLYWFAASPLALYWYFFLMPDGKHWSATIAQEFSTFLIICYGSQLIAAAATMGCMTSRVPRRWGFGSRSRKHQEITLRDKST